MAGAKYNNGRDSEWHMTAIARQEKDILKVVTGGTFATITPDKLAKIQERMTEIDRANQTLGRRNTQTTNQLMTLNMISSGPYRRLRQCLAQIENKRGAIESSYFGRREAEINIRTLREEDTELSNLHADQIELGLRTSEKFIEGAIKEIGIFQEAYEEIRVNNNIPEEWDEMDAEKDEIRHHIRQVFKQSYRDMCLTGRITQGNAEYLEQYGIHLQVAMRLIGQYLLECEKKLNEGEHPSVKHLYSFLDNMVKLFEHSHMDVLGDIGLDKLLRGEFLYREDKHDKD